MVRIWATAGTELVHFQAHGGRSPVGLCLRRTDPGDKWGYVGPFVGRRTGNEILSRGHAGDIGWCSLLPDQQTLVTEVATASAIGSGHRKELRRMNALDPSDHGMVLSPDGKTAAFFKRAMVGESESQVGVRLVNLSSRKELAVASGVPTYSRCYSLRDGKTLVHQVMGR